MVVCSHVQHMVWTGTLTTNNSSVSCGEKPAQISDSDIMRRVDTRQSCVTVEYHGSSLKYVYKFLVLPSQKAQLIRMRILVSSRGLWLSRAVARENDIARHC